MAASRLALSSSPSKSSAWQGDRRALTGYGQAEQPGCADRTRGRILADDVFYQKDTGGTVLGTARFGLIPAGRLSGSV